MTSVDTLQAQQNADEESFSFGALSIEVEPQDSYWPALIQRANNCKTEETKNKGIVGHSDLKLIELLNSYNEEGAVTHAEIF